MLASQPLGDAPIPSRTLVVGTSCAGKSTFARVLWQALGRTVRRCITRHELWHGNRESVWRSFFTKESILVWVITTYHRRQREFAALRDSGAFPHLRWVEFRHPKDAARWLSAHGNADSGE